MITDTLTQEGALAKNEPQKLLGVRISSKLHTRLKTYSVKTGRPMAELVEEAIKALLQEKR